MLSYDVLSSACVLVLSFSVFVVFTVYLYVTANGTVLEQVSQFKYLGSWITKDGRYELNIKTRTAMAKDAFWKQSR